MSKRLPDELFRQTTSESHDSRDNRVGLPRPSGRSRLRRASGVSGRLVLASALAALLVGYSTIRVGIQLSIPSVTATPTMATAVASDQAPYDGAVVSVLPDAASGRCLSGGEDLAPNLVEPGTQTPWQCAGDGVGEKIVFTFADGTELVGVRLVNGNTQGSGYAQQRRILAVRWTFADGSWVIQPLAANQTADQEIRFPPVMTGVAELEVLTSTAPGNDQPEYDAVAISRIEFLSRY